jgi:hypothetical protein
MENSHQRKTADVKFPSLMELMNSVKKGLEPQHYLAEPINAGRRTSPRSRHHGFHQDHSKHRSTCHEPPGAFSSCQPAGPPGPISFSGPLLPRPCLCLGHLHLGLGLRPRCWYILVLAYTPAYSITADHSLPDSALGRAPPEPPSVSTMRPRASSPSRQHSMVLR